MPSEAGQALTDATTKAAQAEAAAEAARQAKAEAEREAHEERARGQREVWQGWADTFDPAALSADVVAAKAHLADAVARCDLGSALVQYVAAIMRHTEAASLAAEASYYGAELGKPFPDRAIHTLTGDPAGFANALIGPVVVDLARAQVTAESEAVRGEAENARLSVHAADPSGYRIERRDGADAVDTVGGVTMQFVSGVAYVMVADLGPELVATLVRYWRSGKAFVVTEVFGSAPSHHADVARRIG